MTILMNFRFFVQIFEWKWLSYRIPGPKHFPDDHAKLVEYFSIFFPSSLFTKMITETNRYAEQFLRSNKNHEVSYEINQNKYISIKVVFGNFL